MPHHTTHCKQTLVEGPTVVITYRQLSSDASFIPYRLENLSLETVTAKQAGVKGIVETLLPYRSCPVRTIHISTFTLQSQRTQRLIVHSILISV
jgi:hypothetical protein